MGQSGSSNHDAATFAINYKQITMGTSNILPDYSYAGAFYSNTPLPGDERLADFSLVPSSNQSLDRTADIQAAIDKAAANSGGVVELASGIYWLDIESPISLVGKGVTLRGQPFANKTRPPTILHVSSKRAGHVFLIGDPNIQDATYSNTSLSNITQDFLPVGSTSIQVFNASVFTMGQQIQVQRTVSQEWIHALGMDKLVRDGHDQTWLEVGSLYTQERVIQNIDPINQLLYIDLPLTDPINKTLNERGKVVAFQPPAGYTSKCSIENLFIILEEDQTGLSLRDDRVLPQPVVFEPWVRDSWIRRVAITGFLQAVHVASAATRITIKELLIDRGSPTNGTEGYPADILIDGNQVLVHKSATIGVPGFRSFAVATGATVAGPTVIYEHATSQPVHEIQPHARWASGVLIDSSFVGRIDLVNRGTFGTGQGWATSFSMAWNVVASAAIAVQSPPLAANLCAGCLGQIDKESTTESFIYPQQPVFPPSLFEAQLQARLGMKQASAILSRDAIKTSRSKPMRRKKTKKR